MADKKMSSAGNKPVPRSSYGDFIVTELLR